MRELQIYLEKYWLKILERHAVEDVDELLNVCDEDTRKYIINFSTNNATSIEALKKLPQLIR